MTIDGDPPTVHVDVVDGVAWVDLAFADGRLNLLRPEYATALTATMLGLPDELRAAVLWSSEDGFCAGANLAPLAPYYAARESPPYRDFLTHAYNPFIETWSQLPFLTIAAIDGAVAGAGLGLALAADVRLATASSRFSYGFLGVHLGPDCGVSKLLVRACGRSQALEFALSKAVLPADEARQLGVIDGITPQALSPRTLRDLLPMLYAASRDALARTYSLMSVAQERSLAEALAAECDAQEALGREEEHLAAALAFSRPTSGG